MSLGYSFISTLNAEYNKENIKKILLSGESLYNFTYYEKDENKLYDFCGKKINHDEATEYATSATCPAGYTLHCVMVKYLDFSFSLFFLDINGLISVMSCNFYREEPYSNDDLDASFHGKILLKVVNNFKIIEFEIHDGKYL